MRKIAEVIAILVNPGYPIHRLIVADELPRTARDLRVALPIVEAGTAEELDIALASAQHANAIVVFGDPLTFRHAPRELCVEVHPGPAALLASFDRSLLAK